MSTTTTFETHAPFTGGTVEAKGFFAKLIEARTRSSAAYVSRYLAGQSDGRLADLGFSADEIAHIRSNGVIPASFWR